MTSDFLKNSDLKDKYFYRTCQWDWLNKDEIYVIDKENPRMITMDEWSQIIYLDAFGDRTITEYIEDFAKLYEKGQVPKELDKTILEVIQGLHSDGKLIDFSDEEVELDETILNPSTEKGVVDMMGTWQGTYTCDPYEYQMELPPVTFIIKITEVKNNSFSGTVEDISKGGTPGVGQVSGKFNGNHVYFNKFMPILSLFKEHGESEIDEKKKHPTLIYAGTFSGNKKHVIGSWKFKQRTLLFGLIKLGNVSGYGTFTMYKEEVK